jgi:hypothetical protein
MGPEPVVSQSSEIQMKALSDKRWLAYLRAHVGDFELLPAIVTHWERTAKPITRPLKVEDLCKAFVLYREGNTNFTKPAH